MIAPVMTHHELIARRSDSPAPVVVDVRWYLDGRSGRAAYESGHIAGAVFADVDTDLSADPVANGLPATAGRHPFPSSTAFAEAMRRLGIGDDSVVVAYDDTGGITAARLVVMLRMLGCDAALLTGDLAEWPEQLEAGAPRRVSAATFTERPWPAQRFADADVTVAAAAEGRPVLDARAGERFAGAVNPIDTRFGHIPGARSAPATAALDEHRRLRSADELRAHYAARGVDPDRPAIAYCGSGVSACLNVLGMEVAGLRPARLYVASWSGYTADPDRPVGTGPDENTGSIGPDGGDEVGQ